MGQIGVETLGEAVGSPDNAIPEGRFYWGVHFDLFSKNLAIWRAPTTKGGTTQGLAK